MIECSCGVVGVVVGVARREMGLSGLLRVGCRLAPGCSLTRFCSTSPSSSEEEKKEERRVAERAAIPRHDSQLCLWSDDPEMLWVLPPLINPFRGYMLPINHIRILANYDKEFNIPDVHKGGLLAVETLSDLLYRKRLDEVTALCEPSFGRRLAQRMADVDPGAALFDLRQSDIVLSAPIGIQLPNITGIGKCPT